ncbi:unnamed protein product [Effrenium voratum]|uniref:Uncharacterized protein n=1 Tax=Effrenium voratum TaxID=2562239 RepID=A0AA36JDB7_9DINO|nr:unnamed protein product [Effrenium voratum]
MVRFFGNVQASLGDFPLFWCFPACPPSGDGRSFNYTVLPQDEQKATKRELSMSSKEKEMQQSLNVPKAEANLSRGQPCLETTAEPTCIEQQQDGCVAAAEEDV